MLNLKLDIDQDTEQKIKKILEYSQNEETFVQNIIDHQINELQKGITNLRIDLKEFEKNYKMSTEEFYQKFEQGISGDSEDFIIWSGIYEMLQENEIKLKELK
jgi:hypothetical protein